jgi:hypothetical protein
VSRRLFLKSCPIWIILPGASGAPLNRRCKVVDATFKDREMNKRASLYRRGSISGQPVSMLDVRARLSNLDILDWIAIAVVAVGIALAIYLQTLRHP